MKRDCSTGRHLHRVRAIFIHDQRQYVFGVDAHGQSDALCRTFGQYLRVQLPYRYAAASTLAALGGRCLAVCNSGSVDDRFVRSICMV